MNSTLRSILISTAVITGLAGAVAPAFAQEQQQQEQQEQSAPSTDEKPASGSDN